MASTASRGEPVGYLPTWAQQQAWPGLPVDYLGNEILFQPPDDTVVPQQVEGAIESEPSLPAKMRGKRKDSVSKRSAASRPRRTSKSSSVSASTDRLNIVENDSSADTKGARLWKREVDLMKNRQAAARCRRRQKGHTEELSEHARGLAATNTYLKDSAALLKATLLDLKSECLKHTECDCHNIRRYLVLDVDRIVAHGNQHSPQSSNSETWTTSSPRSNLDSDVKAALQALPPHAHRISGSTS